MGDRWNFSAKKKYQEILDPGIYFPMVFTIFFTCRSGLAESLIRIFRPKKMGVFREIHHDYPWLGNLKQIQGISVHEFSIASGNLPYDKSWFIMINHDKSPFSVAMSSNRAALGPWLSYVKTEVCRLPVPSSSQRSRSGIHSETAGDQALNFSEIPGLVNIQKAMDNGPLKSVIYPWKMVVFHSYVSLLEGNTGGWAVCHGKWMKMGHTGPYGKR